MQYAPLFHTIILHNYLKLTSNQKKHEKSDWKLPREYLTGWRDAEYADKADYAVICSGILHEKIDGTKSCHVATSEQRNSLYKAAVLET